MFQSQIFRRTRPAPPRDDAPTSSSPDRRSDARPPAPTRARKCLRLGLAATLLAGTTLGALAQRAAVVTVDAFGRGAPIGGSFPSGDLTPDILHPGRWLGTAGSSGADTNGMVYSTDLAGDMQVLHLLAADFGEGYSPNGGLAQGPDGSVYGTTFGGGTVPATGEPGTGVIYRLAMDGTFTVLHVFDDSAAYTEVGLLLAPDGFLYGTRSDDNGGLLFRIRTDGSRYTVVHHFAGFVGDGDDPAGPLTLAASGDIVGSTEFTTRGHTGPSHGNGTVYKLTPDGHYAIIGVLAPDGSMGGSPEAGVTDGGDGWYYGTARALGPTYGGTAFRMNDAGNVQLLHAWNVHQNDGTGPNSRLVLGSDGKLYGTTKYHALGGGGKKRGNGTAYRLGRDGNFLVLHDFICPKLCYLQGSLQEISPGRFLGTAAIGGPDDGGVDYVLQPK